MGMNHYNIEVCVYIEDSGRDISEQLDKWVAEKFESTINVGGIERATYLVESVVRKEEL